MEETPTVQARTSRAGESKERQEVNNQQSDGERSAEGKELLSQRKEEENGKQKLAFGKIEPGWGLTRIWTSAVIIDDFNLLLVDKRDLPRRCTLFA